MSSSNPINNQALLKVMQQLSSEAQNLGSMSAQSQTSFSNIMSKALSAVNQQQTQSANLQKAFELGEVSLPEVIIAMQKASVSFDALKQVRNKLVDAYRQTMNMPV